MLWHRLQHIPTPQHIWHAQTEPHISHGSAHKQAFLKFETAIWPQNTCPSRLKPCSFDLSGSNTPVLVTRSKFADSCCGLLAAWTCKNQKNTKTRKFGFWGWIFCLLAWKLILFSPIDQKLLLWLAGTFPRRLTKPTTNTRTNMKVFLESEKSLYGLRNFQASVHTRTNSFLQNCKTKTCI